MAWHAEKLEQIAQADDFRISPLRDDGVAYGTPTFIWSVVANGALYVRAYNGTRSSWYQAALKQKAGRVSVAGQTYEVSFHPVADEAENKLIDEAYRRKYSKSNYLGSMISARARAATVQVVLQEAVD